MRLLLRLRRVPVLRCHPEVRRAVAAALVCAFLHGWGCPTDPVLLAGDLPPRWLWRRVLCILLSREAVDVPSDFRPPSWLECVVDLCMMIAAAAALARLVHRSFPGAM